MLSVSDKEYNVTESLGGTCGDRSSTWWSVILPGDVMDLPSVVSLSSASDELSSSSTFHSCTSLAPTKLCSLQWHLIVSLSFCSSLVISLTVNVGKTSSPNITSIASALSVVSSLSLSVVSNSCFCSSAMFWVKTYAQSASFVRNHQHIFNIIYK